MDYNEKAKILNKHLSVYTGTIIVLSINILAFSYIYLSKNLNSNQLFLLYISWACLAISFFIGMLRIHHYTKILSRNTAEQFDVEILKMEIKIDPDRIKSTNKKSAMLYRIMLISFFIGVIFCGITMIMKL